LQPSFPLTMFVRGRYPRQAPTHECTLNSAYRYADAAPVWPVELEFEADVYALYLRSTNNTDQSSAALPRWSRRYQGGVWRSEAVEAYTFFRELDIGLPPLHAVIMDSYSLRPLPLHMHVRDVVGGTSACCRGFSENQWRPVKESRTEQLPS
jgi:hypothetical protein